MELAHLATSCMDFGDLLDRVQVVDARVDADFVEHGYTGGRDGGGESENGGRDIACGHDVGARFGGG